MLTLTFLGVGSAFAKRNYNSNALVEAWRSDPSKQQRPDDLLLIDFGATGPLGLFQLVQRPEFSYLARGDSIFYPAIPRIFITHLHGDHIGGLEELAMMNTHRFVDPSTHRGFRPDLFGESELLTALWDHSLKGALGVLDGRLASLEDYFTVRVLEPAKGGPLASFGLMNRYRFRPFRTDHIRVRAKYDWPSYGLVMDDTKTGENAVYSGDTRFDPDGMGSMFASAKLIFHEVQLEPSAEPVHALHRELLTLPETVRRKMILYHVGDEPSQPAHRALAQPFAGFAEPHRRYVLFS